MSIIWYVLKNMQKYSVKNQFFTKEKHIKRLMRKQLLYGTFFCIINRFFSKALEKIICKKKWNLIQLKV